jgi:hypothetical protein
LKGVQTLVQSDFSPDLTSGVSWRNVTSQWNDNNTGRMRVEEAICRSSISNESPVSLASSYSSGTAHNVTKPLYSPVKGLEHGLGWPNDIKGGGWQNKLGFVADKAGASIVLGQKKKY